MIAPFPYFGGKSTVAPLVWERLGDPPNYIEPFFGSGACLLARPGWSPESNWLETINDKDGFISNFWRALQADPEQVAWKAHGGYSNQSGDNTNRHRERLWFSPGCLRPEQTTQMEMEFA